MDCYEFAGANFCDERFKTCAAVLVFINLNLWIASRFSNACDDEILKFNVKNLKARDLTL